MNKLAFCSIQLLVRQIAANTLTYIQMKQLWLHNERCCELRCDKAASVHLGLLLFLPHRGVLSFHSRFTLVEHIDFILQAFAAVLNFLFLFCVLFLQLVKSGMQLKTSNALNLLIQTQKSSPACLKVFTKKAVNKKSKCSLWAHSKRRKHVTFIIFFNSLFLATKRSWRVFSGVPNNFKWGGPLPLSQLLWVLLPFPWHGWQKFVSSLPLSSAGCWCALDASAHRSPTGCNSYA